VQVRGLPRDFGLPAHYAAISAGRPRPWQAEAGLFDDVGDGAGGVAVVVPGVEFVDSFVGSAHNGLFLWSGEWCRITAKTISMARNR